MKTSANVSSGCRMKGIRLIIGRLDPDIPPLKVESNLHQNAVPLHIFIIVSIEALCNNSPRKAEKSFVQTRSASLFKRKVVNQTPMQRVPPDFSCFANISTDFSASVQCSVFAVNTMSTVPGSWISSSAPALTKLNVVTPLLSLILFSDHDYRDFFLQVSRNSSQY